MTLRSILDQLVNLFGKPVQETSSRPDGGTSCYRPARKKRRDEEPQGEIPGAQPQGEPAQASIPYAHTGFTGMNPPAGYGQSAGYFRHEEESAPRPPVFSGNPAWNEPGNDSGGFAPYSARQASVSGGPGGNISYMPGVFAPDAGNSYTHVEHIMAMTSLKSCYEAIECMKNGETLILTLDAIANESEAMRCQDMLAGAAFTLGCNVRMLNGARIVLIAPDSVKILPEQPASRPEMVPPVYAPPSPVAESAAPQRRERRVSQHSAEWEAARSGRSPNYNPYTGNMPAAAGDYSRYGGYGYYSESTAFPAARYERTDIEQTSGRKTKARHGSGGQPEGGAQDGTHYRGVDQQQGIRL